MYLLDIVARQRCVDFVLFQIRQFLFSITTFSQQIIGNCLVEHRLDYLNELFMLPQKQQHWKLFLLELHNSINQINMYLLQFIQSCNLANYHMNPSSLRYRLARNFLFSKVKLVIDQKSVQANVAPHPLFSQVKEIHLINDQLNLKCLQLIQNSEISITSDKSHDFVQRCKDVFGIRPQLIIEEASINLLLSKNEQDFQTLDFLDLNELLSVIKTAFDKTGVKLHSKIMRKLKNYSTNSKRKQPEKEIIDSIIKSYQETETETKQVVQIVNEEPQTNTITIKQKQKKNQNFIREKKQYTNPNQAQYQPKFEQKTTKNKSHTGRAEKINVNEEQEDQHIQTEDKFQGNPNKKYGKNRRNRRKEQNQLNEQQNKNWKRGASRRKSNNQSDDRGNSRGKNDNIDPKILLGINGDTQFGWRQRHRPVRVPPKSLLDPNEQQLPTKKKSYKTDNKKRQLYGPNAVQAQRVVKENQREQVQEIKNEKQQIKQPKAAKILQDGSKLIFSYPQDGKSYNFNQVKDGFKAFVNNSFWVSYYDGVLKIQKGQNGYVRDSQLDPFKNKIMAQGLTLNLEGSSNLEDGGEVIGNPTIQQFTGNNSQFFHIKTLDIYSGLSVGKESKKQSNQTDKNEEKQKNKNKNKNRAQKEKKQINNKEQNKQKVQKQQKGQEHENDWEDEEQTGQIQ